MDAALLVTLHDLLVGLAYGVGGAVLITALAIATGKWIRHGSEVELDRYPPERAELTDLDAEIEAYRIQRARRRRRAA